MRYFVALAIAGVLGAWMYTQGAPYWVVAIARAAVRSIVLAVGH